MKTLNLMLAWCAAWSLHAQEARIWMAATINGQPVRLVFSTTGTDSALFRTAAERLGLKLTDGPSEAQPAPGGVRTLLTEPLDFAIGSLSGRVQFQVVDTPRFGKSLAEEDGVLSWYGLRNQVFVFDAPKIGLDIRDQVPRGATNWPKFPQRADALTLGFEVGGEDPRHDVVYVVTGDERGVALRHSLWEKWVATHADQPATVVVSVNFSGGVTVGKEMWAREIAIGSLVLTHVPVREMEAQEESSPLLAEGAATLGLFALRRLDFVLDGTNRVVYARARGGPVPAYPHNQLGAAFAPKDAQGDLLLAHVALASPAYLAGIRDQDVLLKIDDLDATQWRTDSRFPRVLRTLFWECPPGTAYRLTLKRGEREYQATVVLKRILGAEEQIDRDLSVQPDAAGPGSLAELRARAEQGEALAQSALGTVFLLGSLGVATDEAEAMKWYRRAADQQYAEAQNNLAVCYDRGLGVPKNPAQAARWYRRAAEQNHAPAQTSLGACYLNGAGVAKDDREGVKWFLKAAAQNNAVAQGNLGNCYANGRGVARDEAEAVKWYRRAAEQRDAEAQNNLGACYLTGLGVAKDEAEGVKWLRRSAEQEHAEAQNNLGACYVTGQGVAKDEAEAAQWFRKAAEQNHPEAQYRLSTCYHEQLGVAKDDAEAYKWSLLAAAQGDENAKKLVSLLAEHLPPKQILEGQKWARNFKPRGIPLAQSLSPGASFSPTR